MLLKLRLQGCSLACLLAVDRDSCVPLRNPRLEVGEETLEFPIVPSGWMAAEKPWKSMMWSEMSDVQGSSGSYRAPSQSPMSSQCLEITVLKEPDVLGNASSQLGKKLFLRLSSPAPGVWWLFNCSLKQESCFQPGCVRVLLTLDFINTDPGG